MDKERTTQEGQVTYPVFTGRPGYLPALAHLTMHVAFLSLSFIYEVQKSTTCLAVFSHLLLPHQPRYAGCFIGFPDRHAIGLHDGAVVGLVGFENLIFP